MNPQLKVSWWDGSTVGHLVNRGTNFFGYDASWLARGHNLSPLKLPFTAAPFNGAKGVDGLPGILADCLPDAWGRRLAEADFARQKLGPLTPLNLLAWRGGRGLGPLRFQPVLGDAGRPTSGKVTAISAAALARGAEAIQRGSPSDVLPKLLRGGTAGGAYPKALVLAYPDGTLAVGEPDGLGIPSILKFDLSPTKADGPCEHAYELMSRAAGIRSAPTALVADELEPGRRHVLVTRFDVTNDEPARRAHFHSLSRMLHHDPERASSPLDYRDLFRAGTLIGIQAADMREIARRMVFNVLAANPDDHGKNHAFLYDEVSKIWAPTPAYDVCFHSGMLDRGLRVNGEVWPSLDTMREMSNDVGISNDEFAGIVDGVESAIADWPRFAKMANVSEVTRNEVADWHTRIRQTVISTKRISPRNTVAELPNESASGRIDLQPPHIDAPQRQPKPPGDEDTPPLG